MILYYFYSWKKTWFENQMKSICKNHIPEALAIYTWGTETVKGEGVTDPGHTATLCKAWNRTQVSLLCLPRQAALWFYSKITWKINMKEVCEPYYYMLETWVSFMSL